MHHANFTQNILPSRSVDKTPHELWLGRVPINSYLRRFGAKCYVHIPDVKRTKSDPKADDGIFMGFDMHSKAYRVYVPSKHRIVISRDVRFLGDTHTHTVKESTGSTAVTKQPAKQKDDQIEFEFSPVRNIADVAVEEENGDDTTVHNDTENGDANKSVSNDDINSSTEGANGESDTSSDTIVPNYDRSLINDSFVSAESGDSDQEASKNPPRQSTRIKTKPERLIDTMHLYMITTLDDEPSTYIEASTCDEKLKWNEAMFAEFQQLQNNQTWVLVDLPSNRKAIGCKWVYKVKKDASGKIQKYKARLVAQGFSQKFGTDYDEVFAPVSRQSTFRILLAMAAYADESVYHFDAKTAFLNGDLEETIFMRQPPGFVKEGEEKKVCSLKKSIYGLKQSARVWNRALNAVLVDAGFIQSTWDQCLYTLRKEDGIVFILIYVDDILVCTNKPFLLEYTERKLNENFSIENLGEISSYLGIQITKKGSKYHLNQEAYIKKVLSEFGLNDAKESPIPLNTDYFKMADSDLLPDNNKYRKAIGSLLYIAVNTRPDVAAAVIILSQKIMKPTQNDWNEVKRIMKYLKGTSNHELQLGCSKLELSGYADANWAEDTTTRKSNSGFVFMFGGPISWCCRRQDCVAQSSTEAEFIALSEACNEAILLKRILLDFGVTIHGPITIYEDNQSCIKLSGSEKVNNRSKHIDVKIYTVKDYVSSGVIEVEYCPTDDMVADIFTKPLSKIKFQKFKSKLCIGI